jgi:hypothetical protein
MKRILFSGNFSEKPEFRKKPELSYIHNFADIPESPECSALWD